MKASQALNVLGEFERKQVSLFTKRDLALVFNETNDTLDSTVKRLSKSGLLLKISKGLYANRRAINQDGNALYRIAAYLRAGEINYLSCESVLCNLSIISQQMLDRITVMTTGRTGTFSTPLGIVEFTHTKRSPMSIIKDTYKPNDFPIRMADKHVAVRDLKRIGRNVNMIDWEEFNEAD